MTNSLTVVEDTFGNKLVQVYLNGEEVPEEGNILKADLSGILFKPSDAKDTVFVPFSAIRAINFAP